jgi:hypothetical protein
VAGEKGKPADARDVVVKRAGIKVWFGNVINVMVQESVVFVVEVMVIPEVR